MFVGNWRWNFKWRSFGEEKGIIGKLGVIKLIATFWKKVSISLEEILKDCYKCSCPHRSDVFQLCYRVLKSIPPDLESHQIGTSHKENSKEKQKSDFDFLHFWSWFNLFLNLLGRSDKKHFVLISLGYKCSSVFLFIILSWVFLNSTFCGI